MFSGIIILSSPVGTITEVRREHNRHKRNEWVLVINEDGEGFTKYKEVELSENSIGTCQSIDNLNSRIYSTFEESRYILPRGTSEDKRLAQKRAQAMITSLVETSNDYSNLVDRLQTYEILIQVYEYLNPSEVIRSIRSYSAQESLSEITLIACAANLNKNLQYLLDCLHDS